MPAFAGQTLTVVERAEHETVTSKVAGQDSVGDMLVFGNDVYDAANKVKRGGSMGYCVRVVVGRTYFCTFTVTLEGEGALLISGTIGDTGDAEMIVSGGRGKHAGASGTVTIHPRATKEPGYDFIFHLR
jgi:hypothetical protein